MCLWEFNHKEVFVWDPICQAWRKVEDPKGDKLVTALLLMAVGVWMINLYLLLW